MFSYFAAFIAIGVIFDIGVWYLVKNIQIFDEEIVPEKRVEKKMKKIQDKS